MPQFVLPWIFFFSGLASLLFQVAWQRLLTLYYGVGPVSTTLIVTIYMLGLGLGGLIGGRVADRSKHKLAIYLCVEAGLAMFGVASLPYLGLIAKWTAGS